MPSFLGQRGQEVESHDHVLTQLLIRHLLVASRNVHASDLLELPLDGGTHIIDLLLDGFSVSNRLREHADSVQSGTADNWDLLHQRISGKQKRVLLSPVLDELLVLVEFLEGVKGSNLNVNTDLFALISVFLIGNQADLQAGTRNVGQADTADETLILRRVVVLEGDLELNSLSELALLGLFAHLGNALEHVGVGNFGCHLK